MTTDQDPPVTPADDAGEADDVSLDKVLRTLARDFLKDLIEILFPELVSELDFSTVEDVRDELFATFRKKGHVRPDVAIKLGTRDGEEQFAIFHAEMEGKYLKATEKRLKLYFYHLGIEYDDPPVISAVLFRRGGPKGIEKREMVRKLGPWVCNRFYYLAFGLSQCLAEDWVDRGQPLAPALAAFMRSEIWDPVEHRLRCLEAVRRAEVDEARRFTLGKVVRTYVELDEAETARFNQELTKREEVKQMVLTWDEALAESKAQGMALGIAEGEARGRAEGEARGRAEGRAEGEVRQAREAVVLVVRHRWGSVPDELVAKLGAIDDLERLHQIMEQALEVHSLDELDLDP